MRSEASLATGIALLVAPRLESCSGCPRHDTATMASSAQPGDVWFIDMIVFTLSTRWEGARGAHRVHERGVVVVEPVL
jgi:hypothetical protein